MVLYYVVNAAVIDIPVKMDKAVSESGHICQAFGQGRVDSDSFRFPEIVSADPQSG